MDYDKPNQRHDLLLTMAFGNPVKYFQIQSKDVLMVGKDALFFGRPEWIGEVSLPSGILLLLINFHLVSIQLVCFLHISQLILKFHPFSIFLKKPFLFPLYQ